MGITKYIDILNMKSTISVTFCLLAYSNALQIEN